MVAHPDFYREGLGSSPSQFTSWDKSENTWFVPFFLPCNVLSNSNISLNAELLGTKMRALTRKPWTFTYISADLLCS